MSSEADGTGDWACLGDIVRPTRVGVSSRAQQPHHRDVSIHSTDDDPVRVGEWDMDHQDWDSILRFRSGDPLL